jgi:hypothetical protein
MSWHQYVKKPSKLEIQELGASADDSAFQAKLCEVFSVDAESLSYVHSQLTPAQKGQLLQVFQMRADLSSCEDISLACKLDIDTLMHLFPEGGRGDLQGKVVMLDQWKYSSKEIASLVEADEGEVADILTSHRVAQEAKSYSGWELLSTTKGNVQIRQLPNGDTHEGTWERGMRNGKGTTTWASGHIYSGYWLNDSRWGYGIQTWPSGDKYHGAWANDKRAGLGFNTWPNGDVYSGYWMNDERNGYGVQYWRTGNVYEGEFKDNKRNGYGVNTWPDGRVYSGTWKDDFRSGYGVEVNAMGWMFDGEWELNKPKGRFWPKKGLISQVTDKCLVF